MRGKIFFVTIYGRHIALVVLAGVLLAAFGAFARWLPWLGAPVADTRARRVVAIDPGHGGPDPGAVGASGVLEKDVTLAIALKLEQVLTQAGVATVMTRTGDYDLVRGEDVAHRQREDLIRRAELVNESGAQVLLSLHANSFPEAAWFGAQTFYLNEDSTSFSLATHVQAALVRELQELGPNRRRAAEADLRILRDVQVPAVVVEVGFLSNPREEQLLQQADYQGRVAQAIANGVLSFFAEYERRSGAPARTPLEL